MSEANQPLYQQIYNNLVEGIKSGKYKEGDCLPSEKELAEDYGVSRITTKKALKMLSESGLIIRMRGKGSFVTGQDSNQEFFANEELKIIKKASLIGVVINDFSESYGTLLLSGIEKEASSNGHFIVLRRSYGDQNVEERSIDALLEMGVNGIIIMPVHGEHYSPKILRLVLDGFPIILLDRQLRGIPAPFVGSDNVNASKKASDYLLDLGHKKICLISPPVVNTSVLEDRIEGFIKSHTERGEVIEENLWITDITSTLPGKKEKTNIIADIEKIKTHLMNNPSITCIFAVEYDIALITVEAIKLLGRRIPEDISIICFDGPYSDISECFFTHIRQREMEMGFKAFELLIKKLENKNLSDKILLDTDIIIGSSTDNVK